MIHFADVGANTSAEFADYALRALPTHLSTSAQGERLCRLLLDFEFLTTKVTNLGPYLAIQDYGLASLPELAAESHVLDRLKLIQQALQLSAHVLQIDPKELAGQLLARLSDQPNLTLREFLNQAERANSGVWLKPLTASLGKPGGPLIRILSGHLNSISMTEFTPDGRCCVSADHNGTLKVWGTESGNELTTLQGNKETVRAVAVTPDGRRIVTASWGHSIDVWDLKTRSLLKELRSPPYPHSVAVTADGKYAVSNADKHKTLKVWDLERGVALPSLRGHKRQVNVVKVIPDRGLFISASRDKTCKVWDIVARKQIATLGDHTGAVETVSVTPDRRYAVSQSESVWRVDTSGKGLSEVPGELKVWDLIKFSEINTIPLALSEQLIAAVKRPSGEYFIYTYVRGVISARNLMTGLKAGSISSAGQTFYNVTVSGDGNYVISSEANNLNIWNAVVETDIRVESFSGVDRFNAVGVTPDGRHAITVSDGSNVKSWSLKKDFAPADITILSKKRDSRDVDLGEIKPDAVNSSIYPLNIMRGRVPKWRRLGWEEAFPFVENTDFLSGLAFTPDSRYAVIFSQVGTVVLLDLVRPERSRLISPRKRDDPNIIGMELAHAVTVTGDGQHIIAGYYKDLRVWNMDDLAAGKRQARLLKGHNHVVTAVVALPDAQHLISGSCDGDVMLWHICRRDPVCYLFHTDKAVTALAVTPAGRKLFVGLRDGTLITWDLQSDEKRSWRAHEGEITALKVTPSGHYVFSVSHDSVLKVWEVENATQLTNFSGDSGLTGVDVTPDGLTVIGCSSAGQLHVLKVEGTQQTSGLQRTVSSEELLSLEGVRTKIRPRYARVPLRLRKRDPKPVPKGNLVAVIGMGAHAVAVSQLLQQKPPSPLAFYNVDPLPSGHINNASLFSRLAELTPKRVEYESPFSQVPLDFFSRRKMEHEDRTNKQLGGPKRQAKFYTSFLSREVNGLCPCGSGKKHKNCCRSRL